MNLIRNNHRYGFRSGEWAELVGTVNFHGKECYVVYFASDRSSSSFNPLPSLDLWLVNSPEHHYEFKVS